MAISPMALINTSCSTSGAKKKLKIRNIYSLHAVVQPGPDWPNVGFDFGPAMEKINSALTARFRDMSSSRHGYRS